MRFMPHCLLLVLKVITTRGPHRRIDRHQKRCGLKYHIRRTGVRVAVGHSLIPAVPNPGAPGLVVAAVAEWCNCLNPERRPAWDPPLAADRGVVVGPAWAAAAVLSRRRPIR